MKSLLTAALLFLAGGAHAAGAGCQDTTGGLVLEKVKAGAVGSQPWGCINRSFDTLAGITATTTTVAELGVSTAALQAELDASQLIIAQSTTNAIAPGRIELSTVTAALALKLNLTGGTLSGQLTMSGPTSYIVSGTSIVANYFQGSGAGLTNLPSAETGSFATTKTFFSSVTVKGAFSVGTTTLAIVNSMVGIGGVPTKAPLDVTGNINTSTSYQIAGSSVLVVYGTESLAVGVAAGQGGSAGSTHLGHSAGLASSGGGNTFLGRSAGRANTTSFNATYVGSDSGRTSTGANNTYLGANTGYFNVTGTRNTYVGALAGQGLSSGSGNYNTIVGAEAGYQNASGSNNTYLGYFAGNTTSVGSGNVFIGYYAGASELGSNKLRIGNNSSNALITGDFSYSTVTVPNLTATYGLIAGTVTATNVTLGIGTFPLDVTGTARATQGFRAESGYSFSWGAGNELLTANTATNRLDLYTNGAIATSWDANGAASFSGSVTASSVTVRNAEDGTQLRIGSSLGPYYYDIGRETSGTATLGFLKFNGVQAGYGGYWFTNATGNNVVITNAGWLGVQTTAPATTLDVNGNAQFGTTFKSTFSATGQLKVSNGTTLTEDALIVATNTNDRGMTLTNTSGSDLFKVRRNGSSDSAYLQLASVGATKISFISGTGASYINNSGAQLGIATDSPCSTCTLHVAGGASVTGAFAVASATFTVATTGIVSAPSQPGVRSHLTAGQVVPNLTATPIYFGADDFNNQIGHDIAVSSEVFTVPAAGVYSVDCAISFPANATGTRQARLTVNGVLEALTAIQSGADSVTVSVSDVFKLAATNTISCAAWQGSGGDLTLNSGQFAKIAIQKLW